MTKRPSTLVETADAETGLPVFSVGQLSQLLKRSVEEMFPRVRVKGEISGFTRAASGHLYFALKDEDAVLDSVCWRTTAGRLGMQPEDGMEVVATGRLSTYAQRSRYQIIVDSLDVAGEGALLKLLEERRKKLAAEGLFDADAKQPLPYLPDVIGVVTSPTGAVIRDILHRLDDRFPRHVLVWPVTVQGATAAGEVADAIKGFNRLKKGAKTGPPRPDVIIVARGGGSLEDLWAFNEEIVVRAVAASRIPVISAVGHETDTTLIDFAADERAPTPTAAAEIAVPVRDELLELVIDDGARLSAAARRLVRDGTKQLEGLARGLPNLRRLVEDAMQRLDDWGARLGHAAKADLVGKGREAARWAAEIPHPRQRIGHAESVLKREGRALEKAGQAALGQHARTLRQLGQLLESVSYQRALERGFVLVTDKAEATVDTVAKIDPGMGVTLRFHDGRAEAEVTAVGGNGTRKRKPQKRKPTPPGDGRQGTLI